MRFIDIIQRDDWVTALNLPMLCDINLPVILIEMRQRVHITCRAVSRVDPPSVLTAAMSAGL